MAYVRHGIWAICVIQLMRFVKAIDGIEPQLVTHEQMMLDMKVIEAAFKSAELGQVIKF